MQFVPATIKLRSLNAQSRRTLAQNNANGFRLRTTSISLPPTGRERDREHLVASRRCYPTPVMLIVRCPQCGVLRRSWIANARLSGLEWRGEGSNQPPLCFLPVSRVVTSLPTASPSPWLLPLPCAEFHRVFQNMATKATLGNRRPWMEPQIQGQNSLWVQVYAIGSPTHRKVLFRNWLLSQIWETFPKSLSLPESASSLKSVTSSEFLFTSHSSSSAKAQVWFLQIWTTVLFQIFFILSQSFPILSYVPRTLIKSRQLSQIQLAQSDIVSVSSSKSCPYTFALSQISAMSYKSLLFLKVSKYKES